MVCDLWLDIGFEVVMYDMPIFLSFMQALLGEENMKN
jgi:hypothetical protein